MFVRRPHRPSTKFPCDKMAGDEVSPRRNGWRRTVPATKWQAAKRQAAKRWRRNDGDKTAATKEGVPFQVVEPVVKIRVQ